MIAPAPLSVSGLSVDLAQGRAALRDVGFRVEPGEFVVVLGPNGAGKTTLLRALAGLAPARGQARFGGDDLMAMRARERARRLAYLPQAGEAHWPLPAREIVALGRIPFGAPGGRLSLADDAIVERAMAACDDVEMRRRVTEASGRDASGLTVGATPDQAGKLRADVQLLGEHPLIEGKAEIGGFLYDVDTGLLSRVC